MFGAFSPVNGDNFILELPRCDSDNFQVFLNEMSKEKPDEYKIIFLDNGRFHKAKQLLIPKNIGLVFLPPYSPELNPAEKIWALLKKPLTNKSFKSLEALRVNLDLLIKEIISNERVKTITNFECYQKSISEQILF